MKLSRLPHGFGLDAASQALALGDSAVSDLRCEWTSRGWRAEGVVHDMGSVFHAVVELTVPPEPKLLDTRCTCGHTRCRHEAAIVLSADPPEDPRPEIAESPSRPKPETLDPRVKQWLASFDTISDMGTGRGRQYELRFVLRVQNVTTRGVPGQSRRATLQLMRVPMLSGSPNLAGAELYPLPKKVLSAPAFVQRDADALQLLEVATQAAYEPGHWKDTVYALTDHPGGGLLLDTLLETERLCWEGVSTVLTDGPLLEGEPGWLPDAEGVQFPSLVVPQVKDAIILPLAKPWAVNPHDLTLSRVDVAGPPDVMARFLSGPAITPAQAPSLAQAMSLASLPLPVPQAVNVRVKELPFTPQLHLLGRTINVDGAGKMVTFPVAELRVAYGDSEVRDLSNEEFVTVYKDGDILRVPRQLKAEKRAQGTVELAGFQPLPQLFPELPSDLSHYLSVGQDERWHLFLEEGQEALEAKGFSVFMQPDFPLRFAEITDWYGEAGDTGSGWFTLDLGIVIDGRQISLLPILTNLIAEQPELFTPEALAKLDDQEIIYGCLDDGRRVPLPAGRVRSILSVLVELNLRELSDGPLRLPLLDATRLAQLEESLKARWVGAERLLEMGRRLQHFKGIEEVDPPKGLNAELRPYQGQGLAWLQFLREYDMGGILADDMGLGKTLQALAHLLLEKQSGRADRPSLVVAPTSVLGNWQAEAAKFTPDLRVLRLHGKDRHSQFEHIADVDLVITTYPLLPRDIEQLNQYEFHYVILDEAQNIKNSKTAAAKAVGSLHARHRLCLTGTPLENHLGELWSQFNFLSPGLLHNEKMFRELYRTPIEKKNDQGRRLALAARVRPFILRREKRDVARELPPKSEIPIRVTLEGDQRDLYETVRVTMQSRVREELQARGLARSTIAILDALLKLRQAVTDPRLVKLDAAREVESNAKLDWLENNLPQMVEEGRRVLLFSSFATLLGHLEDTLKDQDIPYSKLTGQTVDRQAQIDAFQAGETHVFLITLKAGGVGLNLTAADTVIHYDPWWNPAAEDQATDRAYRIGQERPVFVYKLIAAGSVEERILDLQARKASLAKDILDGGLSESAQLTSKDLDRLFAPLADQEEELAESLEEE